LNLLAKKGCFLISRGKKQILLLLTPLEKIWENPLLPPLENILPTPIFGGKKKTKQVGKMSEIPKIFNFEVVMTLFFNF